MLKVQTNFEGANPGEAQHVERIGERAFRLRTYSEDGDGNYKFTLLVRVINGAAGPVEAEFAVDWADTQYMSCRDYVLLGKGERWRYFPVQIEGSVARARVTLAPGRHELALHPTYGLDRLRPWQRRAERSGSLAAREVGRSRAGRRVIAFEFGDAAAAPANRLAIVARFHPYETAGSFAAEGALRQLLRSVRSSGTPVRYVSAVLIANPDGVAHGLCKRTAAGGPDLAHEGSVSDDPAAAALRNWLDTVRPAVLLDFHGWMYRYQDGFLFTDSSLGLQLKDQLAPSRQIDRAWKGADEARRPDPDSLWAYARERYGTRSLIFSFGWYGRNVQQVRGIGAAVVTALGRCSW